MEYPHLKLIEMESKINRIFKAVVTTLIVVGVVVAIHNSMTWEDSIKNPVNQPYVVEVAFNLGIEPYEVTQAQFNRRYR